MRLFTISLGNLFRSEFRKTAAIDLPSVSMSTPLNMPPVRSNLSMELCGEAISDVDEHEQSELVEAALFVRRCADDADAAASSLPLGSLDTACQRLCRTLVCVVGRNGMCVDGDKVWAVDGDKS